MSSLISRRHKHAELPPEPVRRFTVREHHQMIDAGILTEDAPFELLEGWLVPKKTRKPPHDVAVSLAEDELKDRLPRGWICRTQSAITTDDSEPEPDFAVVRGPKRRHVRHHPRPSETGQVVEVADTTLERDRTIKARTYARARIPIYWIINIVDRQVEVYSEPSGSVRKAHYRVRQDYTEDESVPLILGGRTVGLIPVRDLMP